MDASLLALDIISDLSGHSPVVGDWIILKSYSPNWKSSKIFRLLEIGEHGRIFHIQSFGSDEVIKVWKNECRKATAEEVSAAVVKRMEA